jgi:hypothetical protein
VGVVHLEFAKNTHLGSPTAGYGFFHWPILSRGPIDVRVDLGLGLAFGWNSFDPVVNASQVAIGSDVTAMIEFAPTLEARVARNWSVSLGAGFLHFSNGATSLPNRGLNLFVPTLGVSRVLVRHNGPPSGASGPVPGRRSIESPLSWGVSLWAGIKSVGVNPPGGKREGEYDMRRVAVRGMSVVARRSSGRRSRLSAGLDVTLDDSGGRVHVLESIDSIGSRLRDRLSLGAAGSYELMMGPASMGVTLGYSALRASLDNQVSRFYQKVGVSVRPFGPLSVGVAVRSSKFSLPDFIEWSLGFNGGF